MSAAPTSIATWPSCPHACMRPAARDAHSTSAFSLSGRASISARSATQRSLEPAPPAMFTHRRAPVARLDVFDPDPPELLGDHRLRLGRHEAELGLAMDRSPERDHAGVDASGFTANDLGGEHKRGLSLE